jgi:uncharacterized protein
MDDPVFLDSRVEMEQLLREEVLGYLGLAGDQPYVVPLNYSYADGKLLFHCALTGQKLDAIRENPRVCFTVGRQTGEVRDHAGGPPCHLDSDSVVCYGRARLLEDVAERAAALNAFNRRYRPDAPDIAAERVEQCMAVEVTITEMTGRQERDRKRTYWRATF